MHTFSHDVIFLWADHTQKWRDEQEETRQRERERENMIESVIVGGVCSGVVACIGFSLRFYCMCAVPRIVIGSFVYA